MFKQTDIDRFWANVEKRHPTQCWHWIGSLFWVQSIEVRYHYGRFNANGKRYRAHRVAYMLINGVIPEQHVVRHKCDNPKCCNPHHLETGTHLQNDMDRTKRGRTRNGHTGRIK